MFNTKFKSSLVALSIASVLSACGGGGSGTPTNGSATNVTSSGTISAFGSVIVNGKRYATTTARVLRDDGSLIEDSPSNDRLKEIVGEGNIVKVRGTSTDDNTGVADTITIDDELVGDIEAGSIKDTDVTFKVLGQTISVSPDTMIDDSIIGNSATVDAAFGTLNTLLSDLLAGVTTVEISGFPTQNGLEATRIEDVNTSTTAGTSNSLDDEIKGFVENLDTPVANQFQINGLTIDYGSLSTPLDFSLANGQLVEVHGDVNGTTLTAINIELEDKDDLLDDDFDEGEVEVEGIISAVDTPPGTITINSVVIPVDDVTQFSVGMHIEIKAVLQNGSLQVIRIQDEAEDTVRTEDLVDRVENGVIFTRLGLEISLSERTRLEDDTDVLGENPSIEAILDHLANNANSRIEARGFPLNDTITWTRLEISNDNSQDCRLRGASANINETSSTFEIEGITIDVTNTPQFQDENDLAISKEAFFDAITASAGIIVQAKSFNDGSGCVDGTLSPKEVSLEPEDDVLVGGDDNGGNGGNDINDNELSGAVSNITESTFDIAGETVTVNDSTLIDDSIIEDARGVELPADLPFGDPSVTETLAELLVDGTIYVVNVDRSNGVVATSIEDL